MPDKNLKEGDILNVYANKTQQGSPRIARVRRSHTSIPGRYIMEYLDTGEEERNISYKRCTVQTGGTPVGRKLRAVKEGRIDDEDSKLTEKLNPLADTLGKQMKRIKKADEDQGEITEKKMEKLQKTQKKTAEKLIKKTQQLRERAKTLKGKAAIAAKRKTQTSKLGKIMAGYREKSAEKKLVKVEREQEKLQDRDMKKALPETVLKLHLTKSIDKAVEEQNATEESKFRTAQDIIKKLIEKKYSEYIEYQAEAKELVAAANKLRERPSDDRNELWGVEVEKAEAAIKQNEKNIAILFTIDPSLLESDLREEIPGFDWDDAMKKSTEAWGGEEVEELEGQDGPDGLEELEGPDGDQQPRVEEAPRLPQDLEVAEGERGQVQRPDGPDGQEDERKVGAAEQITDPKKYTGVQEILLENGLRMVYQQKKAQSITGIAIYCKVGSSDEPDNLNGVSHLIEHMLFKGANPPNEDSTKYDSSEKISKVFDEIGAFFNAHTDRMITCYTVKCPTDNIDEVLKVLSYMIFYSKFSPQHDKGPDVSSDFSAEKEVVIQELLRAQDDTEGYINDKIHELVFSYEHDTVANRKFDGSDSSTNDWDSKKDIYRLGKPIGGYINKFKEIEWESAHCFYKNFYIPQNIIVSVCSNLSLETILRYIDLYYTPESGSGTLPLCIHPPERKKYENLFYDFTETETADARGYIDYSKNKANEIDTNNKSCMMQPEESATRRACPCPTIKDIPNAFERPVYLMDKDTEQTHIAIAFKTSNTYCDDRLGLELLNIILAGNMSSRLFVALREKKQVAYNVSIDNSEYSPSGIFCIQTSVGNNKVEESLGIIVDELNKIKGGGDGSITDSEFKRSQQFLEGTFKLAYDNPLSIASHNGFDVALNRRYLIPIRQIYRLLYKDLTIKHVQDVIDKYIKKQRMSVYIIGDNISTKSEAIVNALNKFNEGTESQYTCVSKNVTYSTNYDVKIPHETLKDKLTNLQENIKWNTEQFGKCEEQGCTLRELKLNAEEEQKKPHKDAVVVIENIINEIKSAIQQQTGGSPPLNLIPAAAEGVPKNLDKEEERAKDIKANYTKAAIGNGVSRTMTLTLTRHGDGKIASAGNKPIANIFLNILNMRGMQPIIDVLIRNITNTVCVPHLGHARTDDRVQGLEIDYMKKQHVIFKSQFTYYQAVCYSIMRCFIHETDGESYTGALLPTHTPGAAHANMTYLRHDKETKTITCYLFDPNGEDYAKKTNKFAEVVQGQWDRVIEWAETNKQLGTGLDKYTLESIVRILGGAGVQHYLGETQGKSYIGMPICGAITYWMFVKWIKSDISDYEEFEKVILANIAEATGFHVGTEVRLCTSGDSDDPDKSCGGENELNAEVTQVFSNAVDVKLKDSAAAAKAVAKNKGVEDGTIRVYDDEYDTKLKIKNPCNEICEQYKEEEQASTSLSWTNREMYLQEIDTFLKDAVATLTSDSDDNWAKNLNKIMLQDMKDIQSWLLTNTTIAIKTINMGIKGVAKKEEKANEILKWEGIFEFDYSEKYYSGKISSVLVTGGVNTYGVKFDDGDDYNAVDMSDIKKLDNESDGEAAVICNEPTATCDLKINDKVQARKLNKIKFTGSELVAEGDAQEPKYNFRQLPVQEHILDESGASDADVDGASAGLSSPDPSSPDPSSPDPSSPDPTSTKAKPAETTQNITLEPPVGEDVIEQIKVKMEEHLGCKGCIEVTLSSEYISIPAATSDEQAAIDAVKKAAADADHVLHGGKPPKQSPNIDITFIKSSAATDPVALEKFKQMQAGNFTDIFKTTEGMSAHKIIEVKKVVSVVASSEHSSVPDTTTVSESTAVPKTTMVPEIVEVTINAGRDAAVIKERTETLAGKITELISKITTKEASFASQKAEVLSEIKKLQILREEKLDTKAPDKQKNEQLNNRLIELSKQIQQKEQEIEKLKLALLKGQDVDSVAVLSQIEQDTANQQQEIVKIDDGYKKQIKDLREGLSVDSSPEEEEQINAKIAELEGKKSAEVKKLIEQVVKNAGDAAILAAKKAEESMEMQKQLSDKADEQSEQLQNDINELSEKLRNSKLERDKLYESFLIKKAVHEAAELAAETDSTATLIDIENIIKKNSEALEQKVTERNVISNSLTTARKKFEECAKIFADASIKVADNCEDAYKIFEEQYRDFIQKSIERSIEVSIFINQFKLENLQVHVNEIEEAIQKLTEKRTKLVEKPFKKIKENLDIITQIRCRHGTECTSLPEAGAKARVDFIAKAEIFNKSIETYKTGREEFEKISDELINKRKAFEVKLSESIKTDSKQLKSDASARTEIDAKQEKVIAKIAEELERTKKLAAESEAKAAEAAVVAAKELDQKEKELVNAKNNEIMAEKKVAEKQHKELKLLNDQKEEAAKAAKAAMDKDAKNKDELKSALLKAETAASDKQSTISATEANLKKLDDELKRVTENSTKAEEATRLAKEKADAANVKADDQARIAKDALKKLDDATVGAVSSVLSKEEMRLMSLDGHPDTMTIAMDGKDDEKIASIIMSFIITSKKTKDDIIQNINNILTAAGLKEDNFHIINMNWEEKARGGGSNKQKRASKASVQLGGGIYNIRIIIDNTTRKILNNISENLSKSPLNATNIQIKANEKVNFLTEIRKIQLGESSIAPKLLELLPSVLAPSPAPAQKLPEEDSEEGLLTFIASLMDTVQNAGGEYSNSYYDRKVDIKPNSQAYNNKNNVISTIINDIDNIDNITENNVISTENNIINDVIENIVIPTENSSIKEALSYVEQYGGAWPCAGGVTDICASNYTEKKQAIIDEITRWEEAVKSILEQFIIDNLGGVEKKTLIKELLIDQFIRGFFYTEDLYSRIRNYIGGSGKKGILIAIESRLCRGKFKSFDPNNKADIELMTTYKQWLAGVPYDGDDRAAGRVMEDKIVESDKEPLLKINYIYHPNTAPSTGTKKVFDKLHIMNTIIDMIRSFDKVKEIEEKKKILNAVQITALFGTDPSNNDSADSSINVLKKSLDRELLLFKTTIIDLFNSITCLTEVEGSEVGEKVVSDATSDSTSGAHGADASGVEQLAIKKEAGEARERAELAATETAQTEAASAAQLQAETKSKSALEISKAAVKQAEEAKKKAKKKLEDIQRSYDTSKSGEHTLTTDEKAAEAGAKAELILAEEKHAQLLAASTAAGQAALDSSVTTASSQIAQTNVAVRSAEEVQRTAANLQKFAEDQRDQSEARNSITSQTAQEAMGAIEKLATEEKNLAGAEQEALGQQVKDIAEGNLVIGDYIPEKGGTSTLRLNAREIETAQQIATLSTASAAIIKKLAEGKKLEDSEINSLAIKNDATEYMNIQRVLWDVLENRTIDYADNIGEVIKHLKEIDISSYINDLSGATVQGGGGGVNSKTPADVLYNEIFFTASGDVIDTRDEKYNVENVEYIIDLLESISKLKKTVNVKYNTNIGNEIGDYIVKTLNKLYNGTIEQLYTKKSNMKYILYHFNKYIYNLTNSGELDTNAWIKSNKINKKKIQSSITEVINNILQNNNQLGGSSEKEAREELNRIETNMIKDLKDTGVWRSKFLNGNNLDEANSLRTVAIENSLPDRLNEDIDLLISNLTTLNPFISDIWKTLVTDRGKKVVTGQGSLGKFDTYIRRLWQGELSSALTDNVPKGSLSSRRILGTYGADRYGMRKKKEICDEILALNVLMDELFNAGCTVGNVSKHPCEACVLNDNIKELFVNAVNMRTKLIDDNIIKAEAAAKANAEAEAQGRAAAAEAAAAEAELKAAKEAAEKVARDDWLKNREVKWATRTENIKNNEEIREKIRKFKLPHVEEEVGEIEAEIKREVNNSNTYTNWYDVYVSQMKNIPEGDSNKILEDIFKILNKIKNVFIYDGNIKKQQKDGTLNEEFQTLIGTISSLDNRTLNQKNKVNITTIKEIISLFEDNIVKYITEGFNNKLVSDYGKCDEATDRELLGELENKQSVSWKKQLKQFAEKINNWFENKTDKLTSITADDWYTHMCTHYLGGDCLQFKNDKLGVRILTRGEDADRQKQVAFFKKYFVNGIIDDDILCHMLDDIPSIVSKQQDKIVQQFRNESNSIIEKYNEAMRKIDRITGVGAGPEAITVRIEQMTLLATLNKNIKIYNTFHAQNNLCWEAFEKKVYLGPADRTISNSEIENDYKTLLKITDNWKQLKWRIGDFVWKNENNFKDEILRLTKYRTDILEEQDSLIEQMILIEAGALDVSQGKLQGDRGAIFRYFQNKDVWNIGGGGDTGDIKWSSANIPLSKFNPHLGSEGIYKLTKCLQLLYNEYYTVIIIYIKLFRKLLERPGGGQMTYILTAETDNKLTSILWNYIKFKPQLNEFRILTRPPVTIYARINDIGRELDERDPGIYNFYSWKRWCAHNSDNRSWAELSDKGVKINIGDEAVEQGQTIDVDGKKWEIISRVSTNHAMAKLKEPMYESIYERAGTPPSGKKPGDKFFCSRILPYDFIQWSEKPAPDKDILQVDLEDTAKDSPYFCNEAYTITNGARVMDPDIGTEYMKARNMIKFDGIFYRPEFSGKDGNLATSRNMMLTKLIYNKIGTYLVTYGYSGVGKSFTLFGNPTMDGLLQATVMDIITNYDKEYIGLDVRIYELYGLGLGYTETWENYEEIDQSIFHYKVDSVAAASGVAEENPCGTRLESTDVREIRGTPIKLNHDGKIELEDRLPDIPEYVNKVNGYSKKKVTDFTQYTYDTFTSGGDKISFFKNIPKKGNAINYFSDLVDCIEHLRQTGAMKTDLTVENKDDFTGNYGKYPRRVKATVNNPISSRGKLIYDFMFKFKNAAGKQWTTPFIVDDTPGAENLLDSYIYNNKYVKIVDILQKYKKDKFNWSWSGLPTGAKNYIDLRKNDKNWPLISLTSTPAAQEEKKLEEDLANKAHKIDIYWCFTMLCSTLIDPIWLGYICPNSVILGYNNLINDIYKHYKIESTNNWFDDADTIRYNYRGYAQWMKYKLQNINDNNLAAGSDGHGGIVLECYTKWKKVGNAAGGKLECHFLDGDEESKADSDEESKADSDGDMARIMSWAADREKNKDVPPAIILFNRTDFKQNDISNIVGPFRFETKLMTKYKKEFSDLFNTQKKTKYISQYSKDPYDNEDTFDEWFDKNEETIESNKYSYYGIIPDIASPVESSDGSNEAKNMYLAINIIYYTIEYCRTILKYANVEDDPGTIKQKSHTVEPGTYKYYLLKELLKSTNELAGVDIFNISKIRDEWYSSRPHRDPSSCKTETKDKEAGYTSCVEGLKGGGLSVDDRIKTKNLLLSIRNTKRTAQKRTKDLIELIGLYKSEIKDEWWSEQLMKWKTDYSKNVTKRWHIPEGYGSDAHDKFGTFYMLPFTYRTSFNSTWKGKDVADKKYTHTPNSESAKILQRGSRIDQDRTFNIWDILVPGPKNKSIMVSALDNEYREARPDLPQAQAGQLALETKNIGKPYGITFVDNASWTIVDLRTKEDSHTRAAGGFSPAQPVDIGHKLIVFGLPNFYPGTDGAMNWDDEMGWWNKIKLSKDAIQSVNNKHSVAGSSGDEIFKVDKDGGIYRTDQWKFTSAVGQTGSYIKRALNMDALKDLKLQMEHYYNIQPWPFTKNYSGKPSRIDGADESLMSSSQHPLENALSQALGDTKLYQGPHVSREVASVNLKYMGNASEATQNWDVAVDSARITEQHYKKTDSPLYDILGDSVPGINSTGVKMKDILNGLWVIEKSAQTQSNVLFSSDKLKNDHEYSKKFINYLIEKQVLNDSFILHIADSLAPNILEAAAASSNPEDEKTSKEFMDEFITLSMESWYINQNITGILKKCSEAGGIDQQNLINQVDGITPWRNPSYRAQSESVDIMDTLLKKTRNEALPDRRPAEGDDGSLKYQLTKLLKFITDRSNTTGNNINDVRKEVYTNLHNFLRDCNKNYKPDKLFHITNFTKDINEHNKIMFSEFDKKNTAIAMKETEPEILIKAQKANIVDWSRKKIDTVIGALMDSYFKVKEEIIEKKPPFIDTRTICGPQLSKKTADPQEVKLNRDIENMNSEINDIRMDIETLKGEQATEADDGASEISELSESFQTRFHEWNAKSVAPSTWALELATTAAPAAAAAALADWLTTSETGGGGEISWKQLYNYLNKDATSVSSLKRALAKAKAKAARKAKAKAKAEAAAAVAALELIREHTVGVFNTLDQKKTAMDEVEGELKAAQAAEDAKGKDDTTGEDEVLEALENQLLIKEKELDTLTNTIASIEDFKMFYVLANNNTQLKCAAQLKTFAKFVPFIQNIVKK